MQALAAASKESYGRAYPYMTRLHILTEVEDGYSIAKVRCVHCCQSPVVLIRSTWSLPLELSWINKNHNFSRLDCMCTIM